MIITTLIVCAHVCVQVCVHVSAQHNLWKELACLMFVLSNLGFIYKERLGLKCIIIKLQPWRKKVASEALASLRLFLKTSPHLYVSPVSALILINKTQ